MNLDKCHSGIVCVCVHLWWEDRFRRQFSMVCGWKSIGFSADAFQFHAMMTTTAPAAPAATNVCRYDDITINAPHMYILLVYGIWLEYPFKWLKWLYVIIV